MSNLELRLDRVRRRLDARWSDARLERNLVNLHRRRRRRIVAKSVGGAVGMLVVAVFAARMWTAGDASPAPSLAARVEQPTALPRPTSTRTPDAEPAQERGIALPDGSRLTLIEADSRWSLVSSSSELLHVALHGGAVDFDVTHGLPRLFRVSAGHVIVEVLGTSFTVSVRDETVRVAVNRGRVRVSGKDVLRDLGAGESATFVESSTRERTPPSPRAPAEPGPTAERSASSDPPQSTRRDPGDDSGWRALAQAGEFDAAYEVMRRETDIADAPEDHLLAADVARLSGHPEEALDHLGRVVSDHPQDPRAPLAAFTLGRVLLVQLGRAREAADAFRQARSMAPEGSLAEDALAREVEASAQAALHDRARVLAVEYIARYPAGRWLKSVRSVAGSSE